jgi:hypothetical protein
MRDVTMKNTTSEMKEIRTMSLLSIFLFGVPMSIVFAIIAIVQSGDIVLGIIIGAIAGFLAGLLFALTISVFIKIQAKKYSLMRNEISEKYVVLYDGGANHNVNGEGVGGWLCLTSNGLFFKSHKYNFQSHELWIPLETVQSIKTYKSFGFINNGLLLNRKDGTQNKFIIYSPEKWIAKIEQVLH